MCNKVSNGLNNYNNENLKYSILVAVKVKDD